MTKVLPKSKVLIADSDSCFTLKLSSVLKCAGLRVLEPITNSSEFFKKVLLIKPDFIILGNLHGNFNEIDLARYIYNKTQISFLVITKKDRVEIVDELVKYCPSGLYFKPVNYIELIVNLQLILAKLDANLSNLQVPVNKDFLFVRSDGRLIKIYYNDILFLKSEHVYVNIFLNSGKSYLIRSSLSAYCDLLPNNFIQVHRSYIVNLNLVDEFSPCSLNVSEYRIPVSKKYRENVISIFTIFNLQ